jgi:acetyl esterase
MTSTFLELYQWWRASRLPGRLMVVGDLVVEDRQRDLEDAMARIPVRMQATVARVLFALPASVRRRLAGRPTRLDGQTLDSDVQLLLRLLNTQDTTLTDDEPADARRTTDETAPIAGGPTIEHVGTRELAIPTDDTELPARLYTPDGLAEGSGLLVYYHGGGWTVGSLASHDNTCRFLAREAGVRVLSVDYRLAPEHRFPAAVDDAVAAFRYAVDHAAELGADPDAIAVGGDSAGGNLSAAVCHVTATETTTRPAYALLFYPGTDAAHRHPSRDLFGSGFFLTDGDIDWFLGHYQPDEAARADPRLSVLRSDQLANFPPTYLTVGGFDPLRDESEALGARLGEAGVPVIVRRHADLIHGFVNFIGLLPRAREATGDAARALSSGLATAVAKEGKTG